ncbi:MAG: chemotaxis protein CheW [Chromatiales bacterium]|jgi:twitching motility protein PilI|nr:chemotaxis protein CheW [Chromatiales bacterium]
MESKRLSGLVNQPFELLLELERRSRAAATGHGSGVPADAERVGIAFRLGGEKFVAPRNETREVLTYPAAITRVPGARSWVTGLANVRGQLIPIFDFKSYLGGAATIPDRLTRVLVANHRDFPAGLVVDEVMGFRRFSKTEFVEEWAPTILRCDRYLTGAYRRGQETWPVFSLIQLVESPQFMKVAA